MKATSIKEAWEMVNEIFPTDYTENTVKTANAGYPVFDSNLGDDHGYICDLGNRLEVNLANGKTVNVWIEEKKYTVELTLEEMKLVRSTIGQKALDIMFEDNEKSEKLWALGEIFHGKIKEVLRKEIK